MLPDDNEDPAGIINDMFSMMPVYTKIVLFPLLVPSIQKREREQLHFKIY